MCIIDDREDVWNFSPNLIHVKPYRFFQGTADINAPLGLTKTENDGIPITHRVRRASDSQDEQKAKTEAVEGESADVEMKEVTSNETSSAIQINGTVPEKSHTEGKSDTNDNTPEAVCQEKSSEQKGPEPLTSAVVDSKENAKSLNDDSTETTVKHTSLDASETTVKPISVDHDATDSTVKLMSLKDVATDNTVKPTSLNDDATDPTIKAKVPSDDATDPTKKAIVPNDDSTDSTDSTVKPSDSPGCKSATADNTEGGKETHGDGLSDSGDAKSSKKESTRSVSFKVDDEEEIEWDDEDDYLYHLEEVLTRIHTAFYDLYDQTKNKVSDSKLPNLKDIIPYVKRKVLKGCSIVFSGVVPLNMQPERSRAYLVARAMGANIQTSIVARNGDKKSEGTTHLVAAKPGTAKVNAAYKVKGVKIVNVNWLWSCAERWERVEEKLFPLEEPTATSSGPWSSRDDRQSDPTTSNPNKRKSEDMNEDLESSDNAEVRKHKSKKARLKDSDVDAVFGPGTSGGGAVAGPSTGTGGTRRRGNKDNTPFSSSYNPLLSFSDEDIEFMDKEVEETMEEDGSDSEEEDEEDREQRLRKSVLGDVSDSSSEESLAGDFPRGWNIRKRSPSGDSDEEKKNKPVDEVPESDTELESYEKTVEAFSPEKDMSSESGESIGSVDDEIADAVEKEFLSLL